MKNLRPKRKHILRNILLVLASMPVTLILFVLIVVYVITPILRTIDKTKFERLDSETKVLFDEVKRASAGQENWIYEKSCYERKTGDLPTGDYYCSTNISTTVNVTTVAEFIALHEKYYAVIDKSPVLVSAGELKKSYPEDFGIHFVVSSAEKRYVLANEGSINCRYSANLDQSTGDDVTYGKKIIDGIGTVTVSLDCSDNARLEWYN